MKSSLDRSIATEDGLGLDSHRRATNGDFPVRCEDGICITTNTIEGYFATLKRGINDVYHHCRETAFTPLLK